MITCSMANFQIYVWRSGTLASVKLDDAFSVKCDRTTMTQDDIDNGRHIDYIGIDVVKPAELFQIVDGFYDGSPFYGHKKGLH